MKKNFFDSFKIAMSIVFKSAFNIDLTENKIIKNEKKTDYDEILVIIGFTGQIKCRIIFEGK